MQDLAKRFDVPMFEIYRRAKEEAGYNATIFLRMVTERGGLSTAQYLVRSPRPSDGYTHLYERGRLDLTVEALIVENDAWHPLFTEDELVKARKRSQGLRLRNEGVTTALGRLWPQSRSECVGDGFDREKEGSTADRALDELVILPELHSVVI